MVTAEGENRYNPSDGEIPEPQPKPQLIPELQPSLSRHTKISVDKMYIHYPDGTYVLRWTLGE